MYKIPNNIVFQNRKRLVAKYTAMYAKFHVGDWSKKSESNKINEISFPIIFHTWAFLAFSVISYQVP